MGRRHYLVEGGKLKCTLGTTQAEMLVTSQQKLTIKKKLKATNEDKMFKPPFFGACKCSSPNPPCSPVLQEWQLTSKKSKMGNKTFVMKNSQILCSKGGLITVEDVGQKLVGTGKDEVELDKKYAKLQGEIIFANGYLSQSIGSSLNAIKDLNPDESNPELRRGHNANEQDPLDEKDIQLASEIAQVTKAQEAKDKDDSHYGVYVPKPTFTTVKVDMPIRMSPMLPPLFKIPIKVPVLTKIEPHKINIASNEIVRSIPELNPSQLKDVFWGYWNSVSNKKEATDTYAKYFNAGRNQHFLNGSHGLASNAAHRMDHGLAQGYHWANFQWGIIKKEEVDDAKEKTPYIKTYSPAYKPVTIVMHSQGNAPGVGFALGVLKYAHELGWKQIPLNLIYLGVHQPQKLWGDDYRNFIKAKVNHYLADTDFLDTISSLEKTIFINAGATGKIAVLAKEYFSNKEDKNILTYLNGMSELFSSKYHKLRHKRGIYEHLNAITDFNALKKRAVQFTFANDRGDMVIRDGDIPHIDAACNPKRDSTLYSVEFFSGKVPEYYTTIQNKEIIPIASGGHLVIPPYSVIKRIDINEDGVKSFWKNYKSIATDWANAMSRYKLLKKEFEKINKRKLTLKDVFLDTIIPLRGLARRGEKLVKEQTLAYWFRKVVYHYARIQQADLYAHFSPVGLLLDKDVLNSNDFNDELGNLSIWSRIKKVGEQKFYRVVYTNDPKELDKMTEEDKRRKAEGYIEGEKGQKLLINTSIANTAYIQNVIKAYVKGDEQAKEQLYHEPAHSDEEMAALQKMFGVDVKKMMKKELLETRQVKKDQTNIKLQNSKILK